MKTVSVIIPAYNEEGTIGILLEKIISVDRGVNDISLEIIVVDDGSKDATAEIVSGFKNEKLTLIQQENKGKGRAVQRGIQEARGDYILVQDADLEYDPLDYVAMLRMMDGDQVSVYGSRVLGQYRIHDRKIPFPGKHPKQGIGPYLAGLLLTFLVLFLYGRWITDTLTGYKVYPLSVIRNMNIVTNGFETDHEISAKLIRNGVRIVEVPVNYYPRTLDEGKKITFRDGIVAVLTFIKFRWVS